jgi:hypothetical protein
VTHTLYRQRDYSEAHDAALFSTDLTTRSEALPDPACDEQLPRAAKGSSAGFRESELRMACGILQISCQILQMKSQFASGARPFSGIRRKCWSPWNLRTRCLR